MTIKSILHRIFGLAMILAVSGCATMFSDSNQNLSVTSEPTGARCTVIRNSSIVAKIDSSPGNFRISRGMHEIEASCEKSGYASTRTYREIGVNKVTLWNLLNGFGFLIDFATGDLFEYDESPIYVGMKAN